MGGYDFFLCEICDTLKESHKKREKKNKNKIKGKNLQKNVDICMTKIAKKSIIKEKEVKKWKMQKITKK